jgi:hypothetical protein
MVRPSLQALDASKFFFATDSAEKGSSALIQVTLYNSYHFDMVEYEPGETRVSQGA